MDVWHWPFLLRGSRPSGEMSIDWNVSWPVNESKNLKSWEDFKIELAASSDQPQSGYCRTRAGQPVRFLINICHGSNLDPFFILITTDKYPTYSISRKGTLSWYWFDINNLFFLQVWGCVLLQRRQYTGVFSGYFFALFTQNRKYCLTHLNVFSDTLRLMIYWNVFSWQIKIDFTPSPNVWNKKNPLFQYSHAHKTSSVESDQSGSTQASLKQPSSFVDQGFPEKNIPTSCLNK